MKASDIANGIFYIGVDDREIDLFEGQYIVENGISYNSYLIMDEKTAVMDTVDRRKTGEWLDKLSSALDGRSVDYLIVQHLEPDHSSGIKQLMDKYPNMKLVGNAKTFSMLPQFFNVDLDGRTVTVKEGDVLELGEHRLRFITAPMVHWPEVMLTYDETAKVLFSADAFGKFGALDTDEDWDCEARRYYFNIVGKYGAQVQNLLKKASALDIGIICPLHGPILKEDLGHFIGKYQIWSSYEPEDKGVFIAYASIYGNTASVAEILAKTLESKGVTVQLTDLARCDPAEALEDAFRYDRMVLAASSYDGGVFPCMEEFLLHLKAKNYQKRTVGLIENGSWAPSAGKCMAAMLCGMKDITLLEPVVHIRTTLNSSSAAELSELELQLSK